MQVKLSLYASLASYLPVNNGENSCILEVDKGVSIGEFFDQLKIPADAPKLIFLNGVHAGRDAVLEEGDEVGAFPPVAGG
jgi:molybdopterin converting factor small subunit